MLARVGHVTLFRIGRLRLPDTPAYSRREIRARMAVSRSEHLVRYSRQVFLYERPARITIRAGLFMVGRLSQNAYSLSEKT